MQSKLKVKTAVVNAAQIFIWSPQCNTFQFVLKGHTEAVSYITLKSKTFTLTVLILQWKSWFRNTTGDKTLYLNNPIAWENTCHCFTDLIHHNLEQKRNCKRLFILFTRRSILYHNGWTHKSNLDSIKTNVPMNDALK